MIIAGYTLAAVGVLVALTLSAFYWVTDRRELLLLWGINSTTQVPASSAAHDGDDVVTIPRELLERLDREDEKQSATAARRFRFADPDVVFDWSRDDKIAAFDDDIQRRANQPSSHHFPLAVCKGQCTHHGARPQR